MQWRAERRATASRYYDDDQVGLQRGDMWRTTDTALACHGQAAAAEQADHPAVDHGEEARDLLVSRRRRRVERERARRRLGEYPVERKRVEVDIEIDPAPETLDHRHRPAVTVRHPGTSRLPAVEAQERADEDGEHGSTKPVIPGEQVAQTPREREDPLAHGHRWEHGADPARPLALPAIGLRAAAHCNTSMTSRD